MPLDSLRVPDARRIAVLRASALGDFVFALPALDALRAAYPAAEIALLGRRWHEAFLRGRAGPVDRVIALPPGVPADDGRGLPDDERDDVLRPIAAEGWDVALQLHGGGRNSNPVVLALGAHLTAGCRTPDAPPLDRELPYLYYQPEVFRNLEVVGLVGAEPVGFLPRLATTDEDARSLAAAVPEVAPTDVAATTDRPIAVLHPGVTDPRRQWPSSSFAAVGDRLALAGARVVVTGSAAETELTREVVARMDRVAVDLGGRLDLGALAALLARADVVIANDTGPLHLAEAVGAPTVGIYWCGNLLNGGTPYRLRHRVAISWLVDCPVCGVDCTRSTCPHRQSFVADVAVDEVAEAALDLLGSGDSGRVDEGRIAVASGSR